MPPKGKKGRKAVDSDDEKWKGKDEDLDLAAVAKKVAQTVKPIAPRKGGFAALAGSSSDEDESSSESDSPPPSKSKKKQPVLSSDSDSSSEEEVIVKKPMPKAKNKKGKKFDDFSDSDVKPKKGRQLSDSDDLMLPKKSGKKGGRKLDISSSDDDFVQKKPVTKKAQAKAKAAPKRKQESSDSFSSDSEPPVPPKGGKAQPKAKAKATPVSSKRKQASSDEEASSSGSESDAKPAAKSPPKAGAKAQPKAKALSKKELEKKQKEEARLAREAKKQAALEAKKAEEAERRRAEAAARKAAEEAEQRRLAEQARLERLNRPLPESRKKKPAKKVEEEESPSSPVEEVPAKQVAEEKSSDSDAGWEAESVSSLSDDEETKAPEKPVTTTAKSSSVATESHHQPAVRQTKKKGKKREDDDINDTQDGETLLRSPILCIMGHVDTGKTKLLDKIRHTNVQDREAGGITQQIGATFFPRENLLQQCAKVDANLDLKVPGLLIIDTPGHASFNNLRQRGSSLCDIAILVVDIMHGLEPQTRESIGMLRQRKCPFVIALNKVDRLYGWMACNWNPVRQSLKLQKANVKDEFETRVRKCLLELTSDQGLNCELYWENPNFRKNVSVVPTSAITGEGIPDLLTLIVKLTQTVMTKNIVLDRKNTECTVLEVKAIEGLGTTIDVILVSGVLHEGDMIVVCGMSGPIVTTIRALLTPHPMKELRVKGEYVHHDKIYAAMGVKIAGNGLEDAVAGTQMMIVSDPNDQDEIDRLKEEVQEDMGAIFKSVDRTQEGVYVMASTLGSLEALLDFLKESNIPVAGINIGTVWKLDVKKASTMRERGKEEFAVILAFDVKIDPEAEKEAKILGVKIMAADIIYHLFDGFTKHLADFKEDQRQQKAGEVVYPCVLKIIPDCIFNKKDPVIIGVKIEDGELRVGTPLVTAEKPEQIIKLGIVESIEVNKKPVKVATKGQDVCIKITGDPNVAFGRQFEVSHRLFSRISRNSIDVMKAHFTDDLQKHARLVVSLKKVLGIV